MKRTIVIEVEETIIETRVVVPGDIHCPACGTVVSMTGPQKEVSPLTRHPLIETISIAPTNIKALGPAEDQQVVGKE